MVKKQESTSPITDELRRQHAEAVDAAAARLTPEQREQISEMPYEKASRLILSKMN